MWPRSATVSTNGSAAARVALNDLEAAFASQLLVRSREIAPTDTAAVATREHLENDQRTLAEIVPQLGPEAEARFADLNRLVQAWMAETESGATTKASAVRARDVFATAERLDTFLDQLSNTERADVRGIEHLNIVAAVVLAPIALVSIFFVMWAASRVQSFAAAAERERAEVVRAAEARAALLRGVTHDVKNPLGAAAGYAQLLEEGVVGPVSDSQRQMIQRIHRLVEMSVETVTDLLELARADSGGLHIEYEQTDLGRVAGEVVDDLRGLARERNLRVDLIAPETPLVTDPLRVRQILSNLVSNAVKYTPPGGAISVNIVHERESLDGGRVGVEVHDTGPGIPPELRSHLFEEFFRVRQADAEARGNGLGLAISRRLARLLGGDVTFRAGERRGSIFTLWLESGHHESAKGSATSASQTDRRGQSLAS